MTDIISLKDYLTTKDGIIIFDFARAFNMKLDSRRVVTMLAMPVTLIQTAIKNTVTLSNANTFHSKIESSRNRLRAHNQIHLYSELNLPDIIDELHERTNKTLGKPTSNTMMFLR